ncbi:MAG: glycosyltransferase family 4 protein, partial [Longimicrobiales bacterium]
IRVIPNWGDVDHIEPGRVSGDPLRTRLGLTGKFVVQFMGNMGHSHAMGALLDAAVDLEDQSEIQFVLIGWGARRKWIERQVTERGLQNVTLLPNCPENELPAYLDVCDIAIIPFIPGMAGISVPSRMYNIMAAGKPMLVLADADSEVARVVEEERLGWVVAAERPAELADRILEAKQESKLLAEMGRRARRVAEKKYTLNIVQQEYARLFGEIAHAETHRRRGRSSNCDSAQLTENGARG